MRRRFLQRKEADCPAIILFRYSYRGTSGSEDDDEHEEESPISEFRLNLAGIFKDHGRRTSSRAILVATAV